MQCTYLASLYLLGKHTKTEKKKHLFRLLPDLLHLNKMQSFPVWVCVSLAEAEVCPCSVFPVVHFRTLSNISERPQSTWPEPSWVQLTAVVTVEASCLTNMLLSLSRCSRIHHTLRHVRAHSDATTGFIVTLGSVAGGTCKSSSSATVRLHILLMSWGRAKAQRGGRMSEPGNQ